MNKRIKKVFKIVALLLLVFFCYVIGVVIYGTITDWKPSERITLHTNSPSDEIGEQSFSILSWNIGFAALGKETSFFYDGGKTVIQDPNIVEKNLKGIEEVLLNNPVDFYLLQEVDSCSKRSHRTNQMDRIHKVLDRHSYTFALNYNVDFVPLPITQPMGETRSGLLSLSRFAVENSERIAYDSQFEWPRRVFFLDRCFLKQRIPLKNGNYLIVINTHCSAYDTDGTMVKAEVDKLLEYAALEYQNGNAVVIGGDWNQCPPEYQKKSETLKYNEYNLSVDQIPADWNWVADISIPTNRKLETVYTEDSYTSCIDHFLVSPNIRVEAVQTINTDFEFSDHQPVLLQISIK